MSESRVENTIPVLGVADIQVSIRFYRDVLGFSLDWGGNTDYSQICSVSRDGKPIMLQRGHPAAPGCVWIGCSDFIPLWDAKLRSGAFAPIIVRPTNQRWALEMRIADPDGNILWFGSESLKDVPFGAEVPDDKLPR
jgi:catechol 2,3-dioxygenase-like lactoylglutathione lyase family enzyme